MTPDRNRGCSSRSLYDSGAVALGVLSGEQEDYLALLHERTRRLGADVSAAIAAAPTLARELPVPGAGETPFLWSALATLGAVDLTAARAIEPHLDAVAILGQAGVTEATGSWGVFAAEGPGPRLNATKGPSGFELTGQKSWCSLSKRLDRALISAWLDDDRRQLFAVQLADPGIRHREQPWVARGLAAIESGALTFDGVPARPVGEPDWYLRRPGFAWGGLGVAAVWFGGAVGLARRVVSGLQAGREPDQIAYLHLGAIDTALHSARLALAAAAGAVDSGPGGEFVGLSLRVRSIVAGAAEEVLDRLGHALGPGPLATEEEHARRVADLGIYLRQWHAERDLAALGSWLAEPGPPR